MKQAKKFTLLTFIIFIVLSNYFSVSAASNLSYDDVNKISVDNMFQQKEKGYYVYFYFENCPDCNLVKEKILKFSSSNPVYFIDYSLQENKVQSYDWKTLRDQYNKKIAYLDENDEMVFLPGESIDKYKNQKNQYGKKITYSFLTVENDIYTYIMTPEINYANIVDANNMIIAGVPTLFYIENNKIKEFYFDSFEISDFMFLQ